MRLSLFSDTIVKFAFVSLVILFMSGVSLNSLAKPSPQQTILILGDSLSAGYGIELDQAWPKLLVDYLKAEQLPYQVVNASISGETTAGGKARIKKLYEKHSPKYLILELGANDGLRGLSLKQMRQNLIDMVKFAQSKGNDVLLVGNHLPPNYGPMFTKAFFNSFEQVATKTKIDLVPFMLEGVALKDELMQSDGLHPNEKGQPLILKNLLPKIKTLIKAEQITHQQAAK